MRINLSHFLFLSLTLIAFPSRSQKFSGKNDSLLNVIKQDRQDTGQVNALNMLASELVDIDPDSSILLSKKALQLSKKISFHTGEGKTLHNLGFFYNMKGELPVALNYYQRAYIIWENLEKSPDRNTRYSAAYLKVRKSVTLGNMGNVYREQGDYPMALEYILKALRLDEQLDRKAGIATKLGNIGNVYKDMLEWDKALEYYRKALKADEELKNENGIARHLGNIGSIYREKGHLDSALYYFNLALDIDTRLGIPSRVAAKLGNIGLVYLAQSDRTNDPKERQDLLLKTEKNYLKALKIFEQVDDKANLATTLGNLGALYIRMSKEMTAQRSSCFRKAEECLLSSLELAKQAGTLEDVKGAHKNLSDLYSLTGRTSLAFDHYKNFILVRDSLFNEENTKRNVRTEMNFDFEKKAQAIKAEQEKKDLIVAKEKQQQRIVLYSVSGGLLLVIGFSSLLFHRFRITDKQKKIIEEQKVIVEEKNKDITDSINYAHRIQRALLASDSLLTSKFKQQGADHFIYYRPKAIVSGDFYWAIETEDHFYFAVCDSTGHGVPGAFMSLLNISFLNEAISEKKITEPNEIFGHVRSKLIENISGMNEGSDNHNVHVRDGMDGTLLCFHKNSNRITYSAANHSPFIVSGNNVRQLAYDKIPVGLSDRKESFSSHEIYFTTGDMLYLFTDGYADQFGGPEGKKFKQRKLKELLASVSSLGLEDQKQALDEAFLAWKGDLDQVDDICVVGIRL